METTQSTLSPEDSISQVVIPDVDDEILESRIVSVSTSNTYGELPPPPTMFLQPPRGSFLKVLVPGDGLDKAKALVEKVRDV